MYKLERFGSVVLPHINSVQDQGIGPARAQLLELAGGGAFDQMGTKKAPTGQRNITKACTILNYDETALLAEIRTLRALIGKRDILYRRLYADDSVEWCNARLMNIGASKRPQDRYKLDLTMEFAQISPIWYGARHGDGWTLDSGEYLDTGLILDEGDETIILTSGYNVGTVGNGGNAAVRNLEIVIRRAATGSAMTVIELKRSTNVTIKEDLVIATDLYKGMTFTLDCGRYTATVGGSDTWITATAYALDATVVGTATDGVEHYYRVTTNGTTGTSEPIWPTSGTVTDNGVVWTHMGTIDRYADVTLGAEHRSDGWFTLEAGNNIFEITRTGGEVTDVVDFNYYDGWV